MDNWTLKKITPRIFAVSFDNSYDLGMHFLRYQEFYESASPRFRRNSFTVLEYMAWYAKARDGVFSYPADWAGYNVPGWVFKDLIEGCLISDLNQYDRNMALAVSEIQKQLSNDPWNFYVLGIKEDDEETMDHELAHGLYSTEKEYKRKMDALTNKHKDVYEAFCGFLTKLGYDSTVFKDEFQAYFSTGLPADGKAELKKAKHKTKKIRKQYEKVFATWKKLLLVEESK